MKRALLAMVSAACIALGGASAQAQDKYPTKPVKILVPYAPGGATDIVARIIGEQLRIILGQSFVVENKPGAFGILAVEEMSRAKPDGYTFLIGNVSTNAITPLIFTKKMSIDYLKSVTAVTRLVDIPEFILVTTKGFSAKSVPELIDNAKKNPGKVRYGTVGAGSYPHFDMAYFAKKAGDLDMIAIHNKAGASGVINDILPQSGELGPDGEGGRAQAARAGQRQTAARISRRADHAGDRISGRRHARLASHVRAGRHPEADPGDGAQGGAAGHAGAVGGRGLQQAELPHRPEPDRGRRQDLARRRNEELEDHHRYGADRSDGIIPTPVAVIVRASGRSSNHRACGGYWMPRLRGA
jgi:hypothetical protein